MYIYFWFIVALLVYGWGFQIYRSYKTKDLVQRFSLRVGSILGICIFAPFLYLIYPVLSLV